MAQDNNPYAAPKAVVRDVEEAGLRNFVPAGRKVSAGRGWAWIAEGFGYFKRSPGVWIALILVLMLVYFVMALIPIVGAIADILLFAVFFAGIMLGCKALEDGDGLRVGHLFAGFSLNVGQLVLIGVLYFVSMVAAVLVAFLFGGGPGFTNTSLMILAVLALMIPVIMAIWFAPALCGLNNLSAMQSMGNSFKGCLKNIVPILVFLVIGLVLLGIFGVIAGRGIAAVLQSGGGFGPTLIFAFSLYLLFALVMAPILMGSMYAAYRDIYYTS